MSLDDTKKNWFTEVCPQSSSAFSLAYTEKLHNEQTPFQHIEIYQTENFGNLMIIDGCTMLSQRDNFIYHEMMTHPALFNHPAPKHIAIVGGGDCGTLKEVAKHRCVEQITQIEIDERVTRLAEQYFPELCTANDDPRAHFEFADAIKWMKDAQEDSLDIIIIDSTDPVGPAEGLFQQAFYHNCRKALRTNGILVQQSESPLIHWDTITQPMQQEMRAAGFKDAQTLFFPLPIYPTGWWSATLAANELSLVRDKQAKQLDFETKYYNYEIHLGAFSTPSFLKDKA